MNSYSAPSRIFLCALLIASLAACSAANNHDNDGPLALGDPPTNLGTASVRDAAAAANGDPIQPADNPRTGLCAQRSGPTAISAAGLSLAVPSDYLAIRVADDHAREVAGSDEWPLREFRVQSETGTACANATSGACAAQVARHPRPTNLSFCAQVCVEWSAVTTRGDKVEHWATREEVLTLLGAIDTIDDALLVVTSHGYSVECPPLYIPGYPREISIDAKPVEGGFEVTATRISSSCPAIVTRHRLFVTTAGQVSELDAQDFRWGVCA